MKIVIDAKNKWFSLNLKELLRFEDLFYFLAWRDIKVRYKQTAVGVIWAFIVPFVTMVIFSVFFGQLAGIESDDIPYPIFVFIGLVFWNFFSQAITNASNSLVASQEIVKKIYFPKIILVGSSIIVSLIDFAITVVILIGMMIYFQFVPQLISIIIIPLLILITLLATLGLGLFLAAINVKYRDVRYVVPVFIQTLLFLTPVIYPTSIASEHIRWILLLNPMTGVVENARAVVLNQTTMQWDALLISLIISIVLFIFGLIYFKKTESYFADVI
jgi:lipopolysaccharide transport system permease protein